jgi:hypothetical protein
MYNTQKMIEAGAQALKRNPKRDATAREFREIRDNGGDEWGGIVDAYLFGVAVGMRIAEAERKRREVKQ